MQASDAHPKASDGHPKASDGRTKAANGQFICTAKKLSQCFIEKKYLLYEKRQSTSRRQRTARPTSQSRFSQMTKAALSMTESANKEDRSPLYNRPKATMRMTESHHAAIKNKLRDGPHRAALFTFYFSLFVPDRENFSLCTIHFSLPQDSLFTFTSVNCPTSPPSSAAHTVPGWL